MGANIGTTITGVLVALKNDYFNMLMYIFCFAGVMMGFFKKEKIKIAALLCSGLGLIFVGLNVMSSDEAFGNPLVENMFEGNCSMEVSPYYSSAVSGLERVADHLVNIGYSIVNPVGSQND